MERLGTSVSKTGQENNGRSLYEIRCMATDKKDSGIDLHGSGGISSKIEPLMQRFWFDYNETHKAHCAMMLWIRLKCHHEISTSAFLICFPASLSTLPKAGDRHSIRSIQQINDGSRGLCTWFRACIFYSMSSVINSCRLYTYVSLCGSQHCPETVAAVATAPNVILSRSFMSVISSCFN